MQLAKSSALAGDPFRQYVANTRHRCIHEFGQSRAASIATTEMTRAFAEGEQMVYESAGIRKWRWNTNRDAIVCPICAPLNGKVVVIGEPFGDNKGNPIIKPPDSHPNCRCWVSPVVEL